jgi:hypothetical protein
MSLKLKNAKNMHLDPFYRENRVKKVFFWLVFEDFVIKWFVWWCCGVLRRIRCLRSIINLKGSENG